MAIEFIDEDDVLSTEEYEELLEVKNTLSTEGLVSVGYVKKLQQRYDREELKAINTNKLTNHPSRNGYEDVMDTINSMLEKNDI